MTFASNVPAANSDSLPNGSSNFPLSSLHSSSPCNSSRSSEPPGNITCNKELVNIVIKHYGPSLNTYFYNRLRSRNDIEDFLQELYYRVLTYKNPAQIKSIKKFVFTIALNLVRDNARRCSTQLRQNSIPIEPDMFYDESIEPERIVGAQQKLVKLNDVINDLNPNCRKAFLLNRIQGLSYKEVSLKMGVTVSMVEKHLMAASRKINRQNNYR